MSAESKKTLAETCLLIGKQEKIFFRPFQESREIRCCDNVLDGIQAAASHPYEIVFVQLGCIEGMPIHALETLRQINPAGRIILLVQMIEEPLAIKLTRHSGKTDAPADDYVIAPVRQEDLLDLAREFLSEKQSAAPVSGAEKEDLEKRIRELEALVIQDDLTGLKNRRYLNQFLDQILQLAQKRKMQVTLLLFDIDHFKQYNDLYGHVVGDRVLQQAAELIQRCCRAHDVVARVGGDEFAVIFWDLPPGGSKSRKERRQMAAHHPREPLFMAERFRQEISAANLSFLGNQGKGMLTISGGLASFPQDARTPAQLYEQADYALLEAKRKGKNQIVLVGDVQEPKPGHSVARTARGGHS